MASNSFIDKEIMASFASNTLAQQFAAFHKVQFGNESWMKIHFPDDDDISEITAVLITVVDGQIKARNILYGLPAQAYERAAYLATEYAKANNTNVVSAWEEIVDDKG